MDHDKDIEAINAEPHKYKLEHNMFSTMTKDEIKNMKGHQTIDPNSANVNLMTDVGTNLAPTIDWVAAGKVNAVQNQGRCGSCWAFSSIATIESHNAITNGDLVKLSEQQLVDCVT